MMKVLLGSRDSRLVRILPLIFVLGSLVLPCMAAESELFPITCEEYILDQGRWSREAGSLRRAWEEVRDATGTDPATTFWTGFRFARCLDEIGAYSLLFWSKSLEREALRGWETPMEQVTSRCLEVYQDMEPDAEADRAAGWLHFWYGRCKCREKSSREAIQYAHQAGTIAQRTNDDQLLAWSQVLEAHALYDEGDLLRAYALLDRCRTRFGDSLDANFKASLAIRFARCETELGLHEKAGNRVLDIAGDVEVHPYLQVRILYEYGLAAMNREATEEAQAPFAIIRQLMPHAEFWSEQANNRWSDIAKYLPPPLFERGLAALAEKGRPIERASLLLELASIRSSQKEKDEARDLLAKAESLYQDPRVHRRAVILRGRIDERDMFPLGIELIQGAGNDRDLIRYLLTQVLWGRTAEKCIPWLDEHRLLLPDDIFRLQKARYLAFKEEGLPAAVDLLQPVIESPAPDADAYRAYHAIIDYLLRLEDFDRVKRLVQEFEYQALDDCWRERVLFFSSYCSDVAMGHWIIDRLLATRRQPGWSQGALLSKARLHLRGNEYGKAIPYLESLIQMPSFPDGTDGNWVGTGHLEMAKVAEQHLRDYARAEALYQAVLDASQEIPKLQGEAFCDYAGFLRRQNRWQDALGVCQRGLRELPPTDTPERGLLQVFHAECLYRLGKEAEGLELLKQITTETKFPRVRSEGERVLKSINQQ